MKKINIYKEENISSEAKKFYRVVLNTLHGSGIPFMVGGALALCYYTGVKRNTKDIDIFIHPRDLHAVFSLFQNAGFRTELRDEAWLGKIFYKGDFADIIFGSSNGVTKVDDQWFNNSISAQIIGYDVKIVGIEEIIWSKAFVMTRERYDGADIMHLILTKGKCINWKRLYCRFGEDWRLLFSYLVLFEFVYPAHKHKIPPDFLKKLSQRFSREVGQGVYKSRISRGTLLSLQDYNIDVKKWGFIDSRLRLRKA